jgi:hypothetical protein
MCLSHVLSASLTESTVASELSLLSSTSKDDSQFAHLLKTTFVELTEAHQHLFPTSFEEPRHDTMKHLL